MLQTKEAYTVEVRGRTEPPAYPAMSLSVKIYPASGEGHILANASVDLNGCLAIRNVRIVEGKNGIFVSLPQRKIKGEYQDVCFPCNRPFHEEFNKAVLDAYFASTGGKNGEEE